MGERIERLKQVAQCGDVDTLYMLIQEDACLLDHIDLFPFFDTPLHIAACNGHIPFVMEMMRLKPSFARKPNLEGFSPIHLALLHKHTEMVSRLLQVDGDLVRIKGKEGITPLHYAVVVDDQLDLLAEFLLVCPDSIEDVTTRNETVLHIALKYDKLEAFKFLVEWIRQKRSKNSIFWERKILNWKNEEGNIVLHIAISKNQPEAVRLLLKSGVDINAKNLKGHTAGDILAEQTQVENNNEIKVMLQRAGALLAHSSLPDYNYSRYLRSIVSSLEESLIRCSREWGMISEDKRNALLVVCTLLITVTYEGVLNLPGGIWQEGRCSKHGIHKSPAMIAGTPIGLRLLPFWLFLASNSVTFMFSYVTILLLIPFEYDILRIAFFSLSFCYFASLTVIIPNPIWSYFPFIYVSLLLFFLFIAIWLIKSRLLKRYMNQ
ncbi:ankyrin repeat-containing protein BDA1-like [Quercus robur]|uniref:ankyrin repeat-containing protein BDA1-like n=1 Tax=Quercus robur TaxID=38942 RepID=UPI0021624ADF|nr:ankyrin repeat-containing protein BDA1-like [Quercus robur]